MSEITEKELHNGMTITFIVGCVIGLGVGFFIGMAFMMFKGHC